MEEITMERLLTDMKGVIHQFNEFVVKKDIEGARKALSQVENLVANANGVALDELEDPSTDHVLHQLLKNIRGIIEIGEAKSNDQGLQALYNERAAIEKELEDVNRQLAELDNGQYELRIRELRIQIEEIDRQIIVLEQQGSIENVDTILVLQARIAALRAEIVRNNEESTNRVTDNGREEIYARNEELNAQIAELEALIASLDVSDRIADIDREIAELEAEKETLGKSDTEKRIEEINAELANLEEQLKASANRMREYREAGAYDQEAREHTDYNELVTKINELKAERETLEKSTQTPPVLPEQEEPEVITEGWMAAGMPTPEEKFKEATGLDFNPGEYEIVWSGAEDYGDDVGTPYKIIRKNVKTRTVEEIDARIAKLKTEKESLRNRSTDSVIADIEARIAALRAEIVRNNEELRNRVTDNGREEIYTRNQELTIQIETLQKQIELLSRIKSQPKNNIQFIIDELRRRKEYIEREITLIPTENNRAALEARKAELEARKKEIDEKIENYKKEHGIGSDRLDLGEEAARIGDHIFKTAEIRRELARREVTREEFLEFYKKGYEMAQRNYENLGKKVEEITTEIQQLFTDGESDKSLIDQEEAARRSGDSQQLIAVYEKMRQKFIASGKYNEALEKLGFLDKAITTQEDAEKFAEFYNKYMETADKQFRSANAQRTEIEEDLKIFAHEIKIIEDELKSLELAEGNLENLKQKSEKEKQLREKQIRATVFGDPELKKEWEERIKRFHSHKVTKKGVYLDKDGKEIEIEYETIEDYPELAEDAMFLNLEDYKKNLETTTRYRNSGNDPYALGKTAALEYEAKEAAKPGSGKADLENIISQKEEYVKTFHGLTNEHAIKYANYRTAGSTLKAMKPVRGELPATTKMANAVSNTFRFFGFRAPKFTRVNENGEKVLDIGGGLMTLGADALIAGGMIASTVVAGPIGLAPWGIGYAAKGIVTLGNRVAADFEMDEYGSEILSNLPTPYSTTKDAREVARKAYYREVEGKGKLSAWFKAKTDRLPFFASRSKETEEKIVAARVALSNKTIDLRDVHAIEAAKENLETIAKNQQVRQQNYEKTAMSSSTYNDIVRDPDSVVMSETVAQVARNAALQSRGGNAYDVNSGSEVERKEQYVKEPEKLDTTEELKEVKTTGGSIAATAITEEQHYTGRQQKQDRINKVWTIALTAVGNIGLNAIRKELTETIETKEKGPDQIVTEESEYPIYEDKTVKGIDTNKTISQLQTEDKAYMDVWGDAGHQSQTVGDIDAMTLTTTDANGNVIEVSIAEQGGGFTTEHVHSLTTENLSSMNMEEAVKILRDTDPVNFQRYLEANGLPANATDLEIATHAIENGQFYAQTGAMEGWRVATPDNLVETTEKVITGWGTEPVTKVIPGEEIITTKDVVDWSKVWDATVDGAIVGGAIVAADALHEAAHQTKKLDPGTHEDKTPDMIISKIARKAQEEINKKRDEKEIKEEKDGEEK